MPNPSPPSDHYLKHIELAIRGFLASGYEAGAAELGPIAGDRSWTPLRPAPNVAERIRRIPGPARPPYDYRLAARVFRRDRFTCRYCGADVVPTRLLMLVSAVYPAEIPFHKNWKAGLVHPIYWVRGAQADHVVPADAGGDWSDPSNVVTSCGGCNMRKSNRLLSEIGWQLSPIASSAWDGLTGLYDNFWKAAGRPAGQHAQWIRALQARSPEPLPL